MSLHIGSRIQIGKDRATVLFIGTVKGTKGEWLGIEWDDPKRGKHEGLHQDTRYFTCRLAHQIVYFEYESTETRPLGTQRPVLLFAITPKRS